ncbi:MFS transporter [Paracoccus sp. MC1862]|uniref:MFS transporter n=1 Tax=Paracoccus sp. MC1862 TaxID=2760307 RepID=UPI00160419E9|nr:MFS transporter [Paracoccus sp. MC1862]MBB1496989.1 MFS transporter [Paracoccus sp. MC1862]QQO44600.1 MFS transporter [Paracoccus sp. MC1862]
MDRKRIWGWWFFDFASQPYATLLLTFIFSIYFAEVASARFVLEGADPRQAGAQAQALWGWGLALAGVAIAVLAPVLGAVADTTGRRMPWIWLFSAFYVAGAAGLWVLAPGGSALVAALVFFGLGLIGMEFATIFTNALMPTLGSRDEIGRISGSGFAFGYVGGVLALAVMLGLFAESAVTGLTLLGKPPALGLDAAAREGTRFVGPFTALWYLVFMIPFFLWVREPRGIARPLRLGEAMRDLGTLLRSLRHRRSLAAWLLSSMFSRDALNALYGFGGVYAGTVLGWPVILSGIFGVVSALSAAVICWIGGRADRRWGPRPVIAACTLVLIAVCMLVVGMDRASIFGVALLPGSRLPDALFFSCGVAIGGAGGVVQAASRTMMVRHTSAEKAAGTFGLYALSGKATAFLAPFLIAVVTTATGNQRLGISPLIVMFLLSLALLSWVKSEGEPEQ